MEGLLSIYLLGPQAIYPNNFNGAPPKFLGGLITRALWCLWSTLQDVSLFCLFALTDLLIAKSVVYACVCLCWSDLDRVPD